jgi:PAS domain-containing protein
MTPHLGILDTSSPSGTSDQDTPPARILAILIALIFMAEMVAMLIIYLLDVQNPVTEALLDGLIMTLLIFPGLYLLHLQPLLKQVKERTRAEQSARANEQLLTKVLELLPLGVWILDKQGKIVHGNPASWDIWAGARYLGSGQYEKYLGWWESTGKRLAAEGWALTRAITRGESALEEEIEIDSFDGVHKNVINSALPIISGDNQILGAVVVSYDMTQRRKQATALIQTNELLEKVFLSIDIMIAYLDRDFNFVRVNENYARSGGYPAEYYIGKNHFDLYPNEENQAIFRRVVETGEPYSGLEKPFEYI